MEPAQTFVSDAASPVPPPAPAGATAAGRAVPFESLDRRRRFIVAADSAEKLRQIEDELASLARRGLPGTLISLTAGDRFYREARPEVQAAFRRGDLQALQVRATFLSGFLRFESLRDVIAELRAFHGERAGSELTLLWDDPFDFVSSTEHAAWSRVRLQELLEEAAGLAGRTRVFTLRRASTTQRQVVEDLASAFCDRGRASHELHSTV